MRVLVLLIGLVSFATLFAATAHAHGGGFRGPPRPVPNIPCDCGSVDCTKCSRPGLAIGEGLVKRETTFRVVKTWGDLAQVEIHADFRAAGAERLEEGYVRVAPAPLLAVTGGTIVNSGETLWGARLPDREATRGYLHRRWRSSIDPLLVRFETRGSVTVRAFPIDHKADTRVKLEGFVMLAKPGRVGVRIYRTDELCLVVQPLTKQSRKTAVFIDEAGKRALSVLDPRTAKRRHPQAFAKTIDVPCVPALEAVLRGSGDAAVTETRALVALPPGPTVPPNLFIGPASEAPTVNGSVPPGMEPPPPPPPPRGSSEEGARSPLLPARSAVQSVREDGAAHRPRSIGG